MFDLLRLVCLTVLIIVVAVAAALVQPEWAHDLGLNDRNLDASGWNLFSETKYRWEPSELSRALQQRILLKTEVIRELVDGQFTLAEAVALRFSRLNDEYGGDLPCGPLLYWGCARCDPRPMQCFAVKCESRRVCSKSRLRPLFHQETGNTARS